MNEQWTREEKETWNQKYYQSLDMSLKIYLAKLPPNRIPVLELETDENSWTNHAVIHIGTGDIFIRNEREMMAWSTFLLGHEIQHVLSTTEKSWEFGLERGFQKICEIFSRQIETPPRRFVKDKDMEPMIQKGLLQECILANGQNHSKVAEAVAFDVSYKRNLYDQAIQNTREHYYILSENKDVLEVTPNGCAYLGEDGKYILNKKDVQYKEKVYAAISRMQRPVSYSRMDFQKYRKEPEEKRRKWYLKKVEMEKYPDYSKLLLQEMKNLEAKTSLMEKKIAMDNPNRQISEYDLFNDKMSFTAFEEEEFRNTEHEIELMSQKEVEEISEQLTEYRIKPETINFSQYQILYETGRRQEHMPDLFQDSQERNFQNTKDMLDREHPYEEH